MKNATKRTQARQFGFSKEFHKVVQDCASTVHRAALEYQRQVNDIYKACSKEAVLKQS